MGNIMCRASTRFLLCVGFFLLVGGYGLTSFAREQNQAAATPSRVGYVAWVGNENAPQSFMNVPYQPSSQWYMLGVIFMAIGAGFVGAAIPALIPRK